MKYVGYNVPVQKRSGCHAMVVAPVLDTRTPPGTRQGRQCSRSCSGSQPAWDRLGSTSYHHWPEICRRSALFTTVYRLFGSNWINNMSEFICVQHGFHVIFVQLQGRCCTRFAETKFSRKVACVEQLVSQQLRRPIFLGRCINSQRSQGVQGSMHGGPAGRFTWQRKQFILSSIGCIYLCLVRMCYA